MHQPPPAHSALTTPSRPRPSMSAWSASSGTRRCGAPPSGHDESLWGAFCAADLDDTRSLSKRQLSVALGHVGFHLTPSETLHLWQLLLHRHANAQVGWYEFRELGLALLEEAMGSVAHAPHAERDGARRGRNVSARDTHEAATAPARYGYGAQAATGLWIPPSAPSGTRMRLDKASRAVAMRRGRL